MDTKLTLFLLCLTSIGGNDGACPSGCICHTIESRSMMLCRNLKAFPEIPGLTTDITMYSMQMDEIPAMAFQGKENLETITIFNSTIGRIRSCAFKDIPSLESVTIFLSDIDSIDSYAFDGLKNMSSISIHQGSIGQIHSYAFADILNISQLTMYFTVIGTINSYAFYNITEIQQVELFSVNVTEIESRAFYKLRQVETFSLFSCDIITIRREAISTSSILNIQMFGNIVRNLECGTIEAIKKNIATNYIFHDIKLFCDCNIAWLLQNKSRTLLGESLMRTFVCSNLPRVNSVYDLSLNDLQCDNSTGDDSCILPEPVITPPVDDCNSTLAVPTTSTKPNSTHGQSNTSKPEPSSGNWILAKHICILLCCIAYILATYGW